MRLNFHDVHVGRFRWRLFQSAFPTVEHVTLRFLFAVSIGLSHVRRVPTVPLAAMFQSTRVS
ncbi:MAG: hypothetical protein Q7T97_13965 [Burkholderiaceae bacterium]|nr:hypothetical protein [Burkholderiaceae bacterium]